MFEFRPETDFATAASKQLVWPCTKEDWPWLSQLLEDSYRGQGIDIERCKNYYFKTLERKDHVYLRSDRSAAGSRFFLPYWAALDSKPFAADLFFCAKPERAAIFELVVVLRGVIEWARKSGCREHSFGAITDFDISALVKRAGASAQVPMYKIDFRG